MDFVIPANFRIKIKGREKLNEYFDLARKLKKLWNMKMTIIPIVDAAPGIVSKNLEKRLEELDIRE